MKNVILLIILLIILAIPVYFLVYCFIALYRPFKRFSEAKEKHKIAILIPSRNEEKVIGNLVQSLWQQNYPRDKYEVYVLANQCNDHTEDKALEAGAKVIQCNNTKSKGDVLKIAFDQLKEDSSIEAYIIFDSDNLADENFLTRMNDAYSEGYDLLQGRRTGKNVSCSWVSCCYEIFYILQNIFFNHARVTANHSASFNGTGWLVSRKYILKYGYDMHTLTEDIEQMALAALENEKVMYVHDAVVYDEYPVTLKVSFCQLNRWIFGQVQNMRLYAGRLFVSVFKNQSSTSFDMGCILAMPIIVLLAMIVLICYLIGNSSAAASFGRYIGWILLAIYLGMIVFLGAVIHKNESTMKELLRGVLCFPIFILSWLILMPGNLFRRKMVWKAIPHEYASKIEEMK